MSIDLINELEGYLKPSKDDLDTHLMRQPEIYHRVTKLMVKAKNERDNIAADIKAATAELDGRIRDQAGEDKIKETEIRRKIEGSKQIRKLHKAFNEAKGRADELEALSKAYEMKSKVMRDLSNLYSSEYFVRESGGKQRRDYVDSAAEEAKHEISKRRKAKRHEEEDDD